MPNLGSYKGRASDLLLRTSAERKFAEMQKQKEFAEIQHQVQQKQLKTRISKVKWKSFEVKNGKRSRYGTYVNEKGEKVSARHLVNWLKGVTTASGRNWDRADSLVNRFLYGLSAKQQAYFVAQATYLYSEFDVDSMFAVDPSPIESSGSSVAKMEEVYQNLMSIYQQTRTVH